MNLEAAEDVVKKIESIGRKAIAIRVNVADKSDVNQMFEMTIEAFGDLDILVNNAGITRDAMMHKMTEEHFDQVIQVHMKGTFLCMQAAALYMRKRGKGKIVNITSISGKIGNMGQVNYAGAKAGIIAMTKVAARESARYQINVNAIQPGFIDSEMSRAMPEDVRQERIMDIPLQRAGGQEDVANAVIFLCSNYSSYITGTVMEVAGGRSM
ncbi:SDR family oxidoreductase [Sporosarcina sp. P13]|uniref:SDR family oxidoreductase n=1 Tax=Sporosarcina sp. P13 TaxID=2048263 RepID=UPI001E4F9D9A|nr:SDR family oxidoreductase [Sporosarcina sp. P13]